MLGQLVPILKPMLVVHVTDCLAHIITAEAALLIINPVTIGSMHYKRQENRDTHATRNKDVKERNDPNLELDLKWETQLWKDYGKYSDQLLNMLSKLQSM